MTDGTGTVTFTGKIQKQISYQITASGKIDGIGDSKGTIVFNSKLQFPQSDVQVQDVFQRGLIILKTQSNSKPLPGVTVLFTAIYSEDKKTKELNFKATTDEKGEQNVRFLLPSQKPTFIILYTASKNEYWNAQQMNCNAQEFALWPQLLTIELKIKEIIGFQILLYLYFSVKKYELPITINLDPRQFKFIITALVQDQLSKPLSGAKLTIGGMNLGSNKELESLNAVSGTDGKINLIIPLKATDKIHVKEQITKDEYIGQNQEFDELFDLNVRNVLFRHDLGILKLQEASRDLQIQGIITDSLKQVQFVQGATIIVTVLDSIEPVSVITDAQGKYKAEIYVPANKDLQLKATVIAKGFMNKIAAPRQINVSSKQPLQITFDVVLDRIIKNIKIKDKLIDPSGRPIQNAIVKIIESNPTMPDKTLYNKEIIDNTDGSFEYTFGCYEDIKFQATFVFQVSQFVPVTYKTGELECKDQNLIKYSMTLSKQLAILLVKGQVIDVDQKPMK